MNIVVLAASERGRRCLKSLFDCKHDKDEITVFTFPEMPWEPAFVEGIEEVSRNNNANFFITTKIQENKYSDFWKNGCDVIFIIGWRYLIPPEIYNLAKKGCFVFHDSYLPNYRGFSPTVWAIRNGEDYTGTSIFKITEKMDEGPILSQKKIVIGDDEYISDVMERITRANESLIQEVYRSIVGSNIILTEQNHDKATYTCKSIPSDFRIDWSNNTKDVFNLIRSYSNPYPGAFSYLLETKVTIFKARVEKIQSYSGYIAGRVKSLNTDGSVTIFCGDGGALRIEEIMVDGKVITKPTGIVKSIGDTFV